MNFRKPKLGIFLLILSAVCVVLKLLISYLFPLSRILLILLVPITVICLVVFLVANRHALKSGRVLARILVPVLALAFTFLPIDSQLELARFHVAKGAYESAVSEVKKNIPASGSLLVFPARYYGYFTDSAARNMIEHPKEYQCNWGAVDSVDELDGPHWGYVSR